MERHIKTDFADKARFMGSLHGLIMGDIIGSYFELTTPQGRDYPDLNALKHSENVFGIRFGYTDDTILTLAAMEAYVQARGKFDPLAQQQRALAYIEDKCRWSPAGRCFDVGVSTRRSLQEGEWSGKIDDRASGNGVLMRLLPFVWDFASTRLHRDYGSLTPMTPLHLEYLDAATRLTHGSPKTLQTTRDMGNLLTRLLLGFTWPEARECLYPQYPVRDSVDLTRSYRGYCEDSLILAIHLMDQGLSWEDGLSVILSQGGDTDTNAAIFGQLYGACYPDELRNLFNLHRADIFKADEIDLLCEQFIASFNSMRRLGDGRGLAISSLSEDEASHAHQRTWRKRDRVAYALSCGNCVHYGEGCMLGYPVNQLTYLRRHNSGYREKIAWVRSDAFRQQWTARLGRSPLPDTPPCYHGPQEAHADCQYATCGYLPETVKRARAQQAVHEQQMIENYGRRLFLIDATITDGLEQALSRIRGNAVRKQEFVADERGCDGLIADMLAHAQNVLEEGKPVRISIYTRQEALRSYRWDHALAGYGDLLRYLAVWQIQPSLHAFIGRRVLVSL